MLHPVMQTVRVRRAAMMMPMMMTASRRPDDLRM
jgi:hypothetical protein